MTVARRSAERIGPTLIAAPHRGRAHVAHVSVSVVTGALFGSIPPGAFAHFNGSPYYPTKVPDLIGIRDLEYIDPARIVSGSGGRDAVRGPGVLLRACGRSFRDIPSAGALQRASESVR